MARKFKIEGIITALLTPLTKDEQIKEEALRQLIDFQVEHRVHGLFPLATTGEGMKLSLEKRKRAAEIIVDQTKGRVPIILHVGTQDTEMTIELAKHAEDLDVDAICAVGPFFYKPDALGLIQHYKRIGEAVDLPLFIYNNVERQGYNISPENFEKIIKNVPQVAGLKDTSYSLEQLQNYVYRHGGNYTIVGGGDPMMFATFAVGASAHISAISNVFPELTVQLYEAMKKGDYKKGRELQFRLNDIRYALKKGPYITPYKEALKLRGIDAGIVSSPLRSMDEEEIKTLREDLKKLRVV
ncbi:MAG: dihydrodipicolinate synthase family protein [Candidatus Bathyarchaeia archaeon]